MKVVLLAVAAAVGSMNTAPAPPAACVTSSTINATAPTDSNADAVTGAWFVNDDRTIWVSVPREGWPAGGQVFRGSRAVKGQKTYWVRPQGTELHITGRRLDADAPALETDIPCCYPTGFQIVALHFPTEGCWEVTATSGDRELKFTTAVRPARTIQ